jgi:hypothetical protein
VRNMFLQCSTALLGFEPSRSDTLSHAQHAPPQNLAVTVTEFASAAPLSLKGAYTETRIR